MWDWHCMVDNSSHFFLWHFFGPHMWSVSEFMLFLSLAKSRRWVLLPYRCLIEIMITTTELFTFIWKVQSQIILLYTRIDLWNVTSIHARKYNSSFKNAHPQYYCPERKHMKCRRLLITFHPIHKLSTTFHNFCAKKIDF